MNADRPAKLKVPRTLWRETKDGRETIDEAALLTIPGPLVILGEAGMGKTTLLKRIAEAEGFAGYTARELSNHRGNPRDLLHDATTLVIDALDELSARSEGDAVDRVLERLGDAGYPDFILSCRVSDWRGASAAEGIEAQYPGRRIDVLHLEPLTSEDVEAILAAELGGDRKRAMAVIDHFHTRNLDGLLTNPQTLELAVRVADRDPLPDTKSGLFAASAELLRKEHRNSKVARQPDEETALDAAGAAFATLILTGSDAIVVEDADPEAGHLALAEAASLPGADKLEAVLGSRLFAGSENRFTYWHRRIGEYLGARWLARQADTRLKKARLLELFHAHGMVPASLRGLHAWIAHHDADLAPAVLAADPMGVVEYGDADTLSSEQALLLVSALRALSVRNPGFRSWTTYSLKGVGHAALAPEVGLIICDPGEEASLRLLLLEAIERTPAAELLASDLRGLVLDPAAGAGIRIRALDALLPHAGENWPELVAQLHIEANGDATRMAMRVIRHVGIAEFGIPLFVDLAVSQSRFEQRTVGLFHGLEKAVPPDMLGELLDALTGRIGGEEGGKGRVHSDLLTFAYALIARVLDGEPPRIGRLLDWLRPLDGLMPSGQSGRQRVHAMIAKDDAIRRAGLDLILLDPNGATSIYERSVRSFSRAVGFRPTEDDVVWLLGRVPRPMPDTTWRELLSLTGHSDTDGLRAREAAKALVANRPDMIAWIDKLAVRRRPRWEVRQEREAQKRHKKQAVAFERHRREYRSEIYKLAAGEPGPLFDPARAYLGLFDDIDNDGNGAERICQWLGEDIAAAALIGFEAYLQSDTPPSATQVAEDFAQEKRWGFAYIVVAALAERQRTGAGLGAVPDDRLVTAFREIRYSRVDDQAKLADLEPAIVAELKVRGLYEGAFTGWLEPQFAAGSEHIDGLWYFLTTEDLRDVAIERAAAWLKEYPDMAANRETELIDRLVASSRADLLLPLLKSRRRSGIPAERQGLWQAIAFLVDFEDSRASLASYPASDRDWLWTLRSRLGGDRGDAPTLLLTSAQLEWAIAAFRSDFPHSYHQAGSHEGHKHSWDASDFILGLAGRLANLIDDDAVAALRDIAGAGADGYTPHLRALLDVQHRKIVESRYKPPPFRAFKAIANASPPRTIDDLRATMLVLLTEVQDRITADPADSWRGFYHDSGAPYGEERCRDHLLTMLGPRPENIDLSPEGHMAAEKRADIIALLNGMRLPIEIKGQWHPDLWHAADSQLDRLYTTDYAAERRGIYVVLWFGNTVATSKLPRAGGRGRRRPSSAAALQEGLAAASAAARDRRVDVVVLDMTRPA